MIDGIEIGQYLFRAVVHKYDPKSQAEYCWAAGEGVLTKYSPEILRFLESLDCASLERARKDYGRR